MLLSDPLITPIDCPIDKAALRDHTAAKVAGTRRSPEAIPMVKSGPSKKDEHRFIFARRVMAMRAPMVQAPHANERPVMSFSLDIQSVQTLKSEAKALRDQRSAAGENLTHGAALEAVAKAHGFRDWNTARASLPDRVAVPYQVGQRVHGTYLEQPFKGVLIGVQLMGDQQHFKITVNFDEPVNVTPNLMFAAYRHRVMATIDFQGVTPALRGNGKPQMVVHRS
jgi:hypothetical protein